MITFHVPPFTVNCGYLLVRQVRVIGHQIKDTCTAISVYEDLFN